MKRTETEMIIEVGSMSKSLYWDEELLKKPKKQKCMKCKKPVSQCNCKFRGRGKFADD
jgi:hypothetical protein